MTTAIAFTARIAEYSGNYSVESGEVGETSTPKLLTRIPVSPEGVFIVLHGGQ